MLRNIPVVLEGYKVQVTEAPTVKMFEENGKQVVATDSRDGATLYVVSLFVKPLPDPNTGRTGKGAEIKVTLETDPGQEIEDGDRVQLINPRVSYWENDGRSGMSWRATGLKPVVSTRASSAA
ncbi:hypothetical protein ACFQ1S_04320 [Kibdelosporangium lantanae]|uniref:Uncharacterized protein n=1 Tax=Kibdelosporangium lantanae TaxID=1497396 RepID=A0ABW3M6C9_9PSEU